MPQVESTLEATQQSKEERMHISFLLLSLYVCDQTNGSALHDNQTILTMLANSKVFCLMADGTVLEVS